MHSAIYSIPEPEVDCKSERVARTKKVYLATPLDRFNDPGYPVIASAVRRRFPQPEWKVIEPAKKDWDNPAWRASWERLRDELDALVVWPRTDGTIGRGCYDEVTGLLRRGAPVYGVTSSGDFYSIHRLAILEPYVPLKRRNWKRYAKVG